MQRPEFTRTNGSIAITVRFAGKDARLFSEMAKELQLDEGDLLVAAIAYARQAIGGVVDVDFPQYVEQNRKDLVNYDD